MNKDCKHSIDSKVVDSGVLTCFGCLAQQKLDEQTEIMCPQCDTNDLEEVGRLIKSAQILCRSCGWKFAIKLTREAR